MILQEFEFGEDVNLEEGHYAENPEMLYSLADMNFDGYKDIAFLRVSGVTNLWYDYYLYDSKSGRWLFNKELSEYANLQADEKTDN